MTTTANAETTRSLTSRTHRRVRLGILASHPVQYYVPWFRFLAERMDVEVFYMHRQDARGQADAGFGVPFEWDIPLLDGYPFRWLRNVARRPSVGTFRGCDTPEVYRLLREERFDAFLIFGWNHESAIQMIHACWRNGVPVLMRGDSNLETRRSRLRKVVKYLPYRWFLPRLAGHLYVGRRNLEYLRHYKVPEERLFFAPHFVDNAYFARRADEAARSGRVREIRTHFRIPEDTFVFLYVGKMALPYKSPRNLVEAMVRLSGLESGRDVHALLVGDGPHRADVERLAASHRERIHFAGFRNQSEMPAFYAASDAIVVLREETWGLVVNEAAACRLPAVVSDRVGCGPDMIERGGTGAVFSYGDADSLVRAMLEVKELRRRGPEALRAALAAKSTLYSMEKATEGLERALERVAGAPKFSDMAARGVIKRTTKVEEVR